MMKKLLAGMLALSCILAVTGCSENETDDSSKKSAASSSVAESEASSEAEETTTTTTTAAETTTTTADTTTTAEETTTTAAETKPSAGTDGVYSDADFEATFDPDVWKYLDMSSVDAQEMASEALGMNLGGGSTSINCCYTHLEHTTTNINIISTAVPGATADIETEEFLSYFTDLLGSVSDSFELVESKSVKVGSNNGVYLKLKVDLGSGTPFIEEQYDLFGDGKMVACTFSAAEADYDDCADDFKAVLDSLKIK